MTIKELVLKIRASRVMNRPGASGEDAKFRLSDRDAVEHIEAYVNNALLNHHSTIKREMFNMLEAATYHEDRNEYTICMTADYFNLLREFLKGNIPNETGS